MEVAARGVGLGSAALLAVLSLGALLHVTLRSQLSPIPGWRPADDRASGGREAAWVAVLILAFVVLGAACNLARVLETEFGENVRWEGVLQVGCAGSGTLATAAGALFAGNVIELTKWSHRQQEGRSEEFSDTRRWLRGHRWWIAYLPATITLGLGTAACVLWTHIRGLPLSAVASVTALPSAVTLFVTLCITAIRSVDPVLPALSLLVATGLAGCSVALLGAKPTLPAPVGPEALATILFAGAVALLWAGLSLWTRRAPRTRRTSVQDTSVADGAVGAVGPSLRGERQMVAITIAWFAMGFVNSLPNVALRQYLIEELRASPATQAIIYGVIGPMPWNFKFVAAFLSDSVPICGRRRLPYFIFALLLQAGGWAALGLAPPSIGATAALRLVMLFGSMLHGVMCDTIVVETMKRYESDGDKGKLQSGTWLAGLSGGLVASPISGWVLEYYPQFTYRGCMLFVAALNVAQLLVVLFLADPKQTKQVVAATAARAAAHDPSTASCSPPETGNLDSEHHSQQQPPSQARQVWRAMQLNQVWKPMIFVIIFALAPGNGDAFNSFLLSDPDAREEGPWPGGIAPLNFSDSEFAYVGTVASAANVLGTWVFRRFLRTVPWRPLFVVAIVVSTGLSFLELILIFQINQKWGIPNLVFAMGDDLINVVVGQMVSMPIWVMMGQLCPPGVEGSVFAMVTSLQMVGSTISGTLSAQLTLALGVTLTDYSNLPLLTMITASLKLTALPFVVLAPKHIHEAAPQSAKATALAKAPTKGSSAEPVDEPLLGKQSVGDQIGSSWWGAFWLAFGLSTGILYSVTNAIYRLARADGDA